VPARAHIRAAHRHADAYSAQGAVLHPATAGTDEAPARPHREWIRPFLSRPPCWSGPIQIPSKTGV